MTFYDNVTTVCKRKGFNVTTALKVAGLSTSKGTAWKRGGRPALEDLRKLAEAIGVSPIEIMDWETDQDVLMKKAAPALSEDSLELLQIYDKLSPEMRKVAIMQTRALLEVRK